MAVKCPKCHSTDMQAQLNSYQCLNCGKRTAMKDIPQPTPPKE